MRSWLLIVLGIIFSILVTCIAIYSRLIHNPSELKASINSAISIQSTPQPTSSPSPFLIPTNISTPGMTPTPSITETSAPSPLSSSLPHFNPLSSVSPSGTPIPTPESSGSILSVDENGLSHATVVMNTSEGIIKFKFYPNDAPQTVKRITELINKGFYNGLSFHRVIPGFVVQGGDPSGTGTGGSGQRLKAEFNSRHHIEGTLAMARAADPDSADSQFYISLGVQPHLDRNYTVFGQVIEGMDVVKKIKVGDKMLTLTIQ